MEKVLILFAQAFNNRREIRELMTASGVKVEAQISCFITPRELIRLGVSEDIRPGVAKVWLIEDDSGALEALKNHPASKNIYYSQPDKAGEDVKSFFPSVLPKR